MAISVVSVLIQSYMKHKTRIRMYSSGEFNPQEFYSKMQHYDDFILDNNPLVDSWAKKYDKISIAE